MKMLYNPVQNIFILFLYYYFIVTNITNYFLLL